MAANLPDDIDLVCRLACFGSEDGTFHVLNKGQSPHHAQTIKSILSRNRGPEVVKRLKTIANKKCYVKRENLLFSLAAVTDKFGEDGDDHKTDPLSHEAYSVVQELCESPSDLFTFVHFKKQISPMTHAPWGRGMRSLVSDFYAKKSPAVLAQQITQCKSGHGFSHKDLIKLTHLHCDKTNSKGTDLVLNYALKGKKALEKKEADAGSNDEGVERVAAILEGVERLRSSQETEGEVIRSLIETNSLVDKQIPTHFLRLPEAFEGLLGHMTLDSLVKNIHKMAELGLLDPRSLDADKVINRLKDAKGFEQERVSPVTVFAAQRKYDINRNKKWIRNPKLSGALKVAYNHTLNNMPSTNKRYLLAIHMDDKAIVKTCVTGCSCMSPIMPCVILSQTLARTETNPQLVYFRNSTTVELSLSKNDTSVAILEQIIKQTKEPTNEQYDLCEPLKWAADKKKAFDCILIVVCKKRVTAHDELKAAISHYRSEAGVPDAKVVVMGLADPVSFPDRDDLNFLDVTGFDEDVLALVQTFCKGLPQTDAME